MRGARSKIAVVAWELAHNAASCAFTLADLLRREHDVEIIGPTFLGKEIWEPIRETDIPIRAFPGAGLPGFVEDAEWFVESVYADVVIACKPRLPSLLLAMLIKDQCEAPVILHVDDLELGLVGAHAGISLDELSLRRESADFAHPAGSLWVAACDGLAAGADAIIVSGEPLQRRYGGTMLGQPRDETRFDPARFDAAAVRAEFGYTAEDRVVLFVGSPRRHKGILELAAAVADLDDPRIKLCVIGTFNDTGLRETVAGFDPGRIQLLDYRPIAEVPRLMMLGDLVCLPQDPSVEFVAYQTPMKLTEALAMGVPVLARETPALAPFARRGVIATIGDVPLGERIRSMLADPAGLARLARVGREFFLSRLSYDVAVQTMSRVIAGLPRSGGDVPPSWERACELASSATRAGAARFPR
jgi:glycosyltransferase involved in cell wall biosynthesis